MMYASAQELTRGIINQRRDSFIAILESSLSERRNCSAYLARQIEETLRGPGVRRVSLSRVVLAVIIDQLLLLALFAFLFCPPMLGSQGGLLSKTIGGIGIFPIHNIAAANTIFAAAECILLQIFLYCARFESSAWQTTPGKLLMGIRICDQDGEALNFAGSAGRLVGQHLLVMIATLTIVIPVSYELRKAFPEEALKVLLPLVPFIAYFWLTFIRVDGRTIFQMVSRVPVANEAKLSVKTASEFFEILFFGNTKSSGKSRLDMYLTALCLINCLWLVSYAVAWCNRG